jgi:hypothetical protein
MPGDETSAHNALEACKKTSGKAKWKCLKKARKHNATLTVAPQRQRSRLLVNHPGPLAGHV